MPTFKVRMKKKKEKKGKTPVSQKFFARSEERLLEQELSIMLCFVSKSMPVRYPSITQNYYKS